MELRLLFTGDTQGGRLSSSGRQLMQSQDSKSFLTPMLLVLGFGVKDTACQNKMDLFSGHRVYSRLCESQAETMAFLGWLLPDGEAGGGVKDSDFRYQPALKIPQGLGNVPLFSFLGLCFPNL